MLVRVMTWIERILYRNEFTMEPGVFESFILGIAELPAESRTPRSA